MFLIISINYKQPSLISEMNSWFNWVFFEKFFGHLSEGVRRAHWVCHFFWIWISKPYLAIIRKKIVFSRLFIFWQTRYFSAFGNIDCSSDYILTSNWSNVDLLRFFDFTDLPRQCGVYPLLVKSSIWKFIRFEETHTENFYITACKQQNVN